MARADPAADAAMAAIEAAANPAAKQMFDYQVDNQEPDKPLRVIATNPNWRRTTITCFLLPGAQPSPFAAFAQSSF